LDRRADITVASPAEPPADGDSSIAAPPAARPLRFLGWRIAWGALTLQGTIAALFLQAYGVYAAFWMAEFGWSRTTISLIYSLHRTESGLLGPLHGWLLQRVSPRRLILVGVLMLGGGFLVLAAVDGLGAFIATFLVMAVGASFAGILSLTTVLVNWFERRRARAMAMLATGLSLGGLAVPLVGASMEAFGWRATSAGSGLFVLAIGIPLSRLMHRDPEGLGMRPDGDAPNGPRGSESRPAAPAWTARQALGSRAFWQISIGHATAIAVVSAVIVHFVVYVQQTLGLGVTLAATVLTVATAVTILGQAIGGWLGDRYPKRHLAGIGMLGHAGAMALLASAVHLWVVVVAAILHGLAWGLRGPLMGAMRADHFGRASFAMVMGVSSMVVMLGSVLGPLLLGLLADMTGDYRAGFLGLAAIAVAGALTFFTLAEPHEPGATRPNSRTEAAP
jgi:MFS family permease